MVLFTSATPASARKLSRFVSRVSSVVFAVPHVFGLARIVIGQVLQFSEGDEGDDRADLGGSSRQGWSDCQSECPGAVNVVELQSSPIRVPGPNSCKPATNPSRIVMPTCSETGFYLLNGRWFHLQMGPHQVVGVTFAFFEPSADPSVGRIFCGGGPSFARTCIHPVLKIPIQIQSRCGVRAVASTRSQLRRICRTSPLNICRFHSLPSSATKSNAPPVPAGAQSTPRGRAKASLKEPSGHGTEFPRDTKIPAIKPYARYPHRSLRNPHSNKPRSGTTTTSFGRTY